MRRPKPTADTTTTPVERPQPSHSRLHESEIRLSNGAVAIGAIFFVAAPFFLPCSSWTSPAVDTSSTCRATRMRVRQFCDRPPSDSEKLLPSMLGDSSSSRKPFLLLTGVTGVLNKARGVLDMARKKKSTSTPEFDLFRATANLRIESLLSFTRERLSCSSPTFARGPARSWGSRRRGPCPCRG